ncbi:MAG: cysteine dioxygenase family protein [Geodermatophilaceae bacterium]|nr:cysteine dioxygenase family protein [Geodermatophilaceae bacterium]
MTTSLRAPTPAAPAALTALLARLRVAVVGRDGAAGAADRVAAVLGARTPTLDVLTASQRQGDPDRLTSRVLHAEGLFSVVALAWRPGQETPIHDHLAWCVVTVLAGTEEETLYRDHGDHLSVLAHTANVTGSVTAIAPPGDVHRVRNESDTTAISLHVYGADLGVVGSSIRRTYDLPILGSASREL